MNWQDKKRRAVLFGLRKDKDISQERMSRMLGIARATYLRKEANFTFTIQELDKMAEILGTTTIHLLDV